MTCVLILRSPVLFSVWAFRLVVCLVGFCGLFGFGFDFLKFFILLFVCNEVIFFTYFQALIFL